MRSEEKGKLVYDERLEGWAKDSKIILSRELRHSILKITPEMARSAAVSAAEPPPAAASVERIAEIIDAEPARREAGRARFRAYRQLGCEPVTHTLRGP